MVKQNNKYISMTNVTLPFSHSKVHTPWRGNQNHHWILDKSLLDLMLILTTTSENVGVRVCVAFLYINIEIQWYQKQTRTSERQRMSPPLDWHPWQAQQYLQALWMLGPLFEICWDQKVLGDEDLVLQQSLCLALSCKKEN